MAGFFQHSPDHVRAKEIIADVAAGRANEAIALRDNFEELAVFVCRDDYAFVRNASSAEKKASKRFLRQIISTTFPKFECLPILSGQFGQQQLELFRSQGCVSFGRYVSADECATIEEAIKPLPVFNAHIAGVSDRKPRMIGDDNDPAEQFQFGSIDEEVIASLEFIGRLALNDHLVEFLTAYFGSPPVLRDLHLWWSFPSSSKYGPQPHAGQQFHRDYRSVQDVQFFVCLKDMPGNDGAHEYLRGTHDEEAFRAVRPESDAAFTNRVFYPPNDGYGNDEAWLNLLHPRQLFPIKAGHAFMIDAMGLHRGIPPLKRRRLMFSARFSASGNEKAIYRAYAEHETLQMMQYVFHAYSEKINRDVLSDWKRDNSNSIPVARSLINRVMAGLRSAFD